MALTKVQTIGIETGISLTGVTTVTTLNASTDTLSVGGTVNFGGNVSIAGTLTYEDVTNIDAVGLITARNGIKVDDLGVQVGTGATVDSAAANTLTFLTGGSERARIDSSGKMGLGTNSPSQNLHIYQATGDDVGIRIQNSDGFAELEVDADELNYNADSHVFNNQADSAERMRIDGSGNVQVSAGQFTVGTTASTGLQLINDGTFGTIQSADLKIRTGSTERLRISSDAPHLLLGGTADVNEITESSSNTGMVIGSTSVGNGGLAIINSTSGTGRIYFGDATGSNAARNRGQINYYHNGDYMMFATAGSERLRIDSSSRVLIDTTADRPIEMPFGNTLNSAQPGKLVIEDSGAGHLNMIIARENQSNAYGPAISLVKSRGTSDGSYTVVQSGDNLGTIQFGGADGSADRVGAAIVAQVDTTPGSDDMPGRIMFATTPDGSGHPVERLRIDKDGSVTKPTNPLLKTNMGATYGGNATLHDSPDVSILQAAAEIDKGNNGWTTSGSNAYTFVCPVAGVYAVHAHFSLDDITQGNRVIFAMAYTDGGGNLPLSSYVELMDTNVDDYQNYSYYNTWSFSAGTRIGFGINTTGSGGTLTGFNSQWGIHLLQ